MFGISRPIDVGADSDIDHDMADDYDSPLTDLEDSADDNEYSSLEETFSESSGSEYGGKTYSNCYFLFSKRKHSRLTFAFRETARKKTR
jgi:hypothetical protein